MVDGNLTQVERSVGERVRTLREVDLHHIPALTSDDNRRPLRRVPVDASHRRWHVDEADGREGDERRVLNQLMDENRQILRCRHADGSLRVDGNLRDGLAVTFHNLHQLELIAMLQLVIERNHADDAVGEAQNHDSARRVDGDGQPDEVTASREELVVENHFLVEEIVNVQPSITP